MLRRIPVAGASVAAAPSSATILCRSALAVRFLRGSLPQRTSSLVSGVDCVDAEPELSPARGAKQDGSHASEFLHPVLQGANDTQGARVRVEGEGLVRWERPRAAERLRGAAGARKRLHTRRDLGGGGTLRGESPPWASIALLRR